MTGSPGRRGAGWCWCWPSGCRAAGRCGSPPRRPPRAAPTTASARCTSRGRPSGSAVCSESGRESNPVPGLAPAPPPPPPRPRRRRAARRPRRPARSRAECGPGAAAAPTRPCPRRRSRVRSPGAPAGSPGAVCCCFCCLPGLGAPTHRALLGPGVGARRGAVPGEDHHSHGRAGASRPGPHGRRAPGFRGSTTREHDPLISHRSHLSITQQTAILIWRGGHWSTRPANRGRAVKPRPACHGVNGRAATPPN